MKISTMIKSDTTRHQMGFFDLGFSLALLALCGAFTYAVTPGEDDRAAVQEQQLEARANLDTGNESAYLYK